MANLKVIAPENSHGMTSVVTINAPLEKVFEAFTNADLFKVWWSRGNEMKVHHFDARDGGSWHVSELADGEEAAFFGTFHEIALNKRIVQTFEYLGMPERGHVSLERCDFAEADGTTTITMHSTFLSVEDRDGMIKSGMEDGFRQSVNALGKLLEQ